MEHDSYDLSLAGVGGVADFTAMAGITKEGGRWLSLVSSW